MQDDRDIFADHPFFSPRADLVHDLAHVLECVECPLELAIRRVDSGHVVERGRFPSPVADRPPDGQQQWAVQEDWQPREDAEERD